jgi:hypothetical protein
MSQEIESIYDQYILNLQKAIPNVEPNLLHRVMYLERKLSNEYVKSPQCMLTIEYKQEVDMDKKLYDLREKYSLEAEYSDIHNILFAVSRMKTDKIREIASDPDIIKISGKSNPIIRS